MQENYFNHLTDKERNILKNKGTEPAFSGKYNNFFEAGVFLCRACNNPLYEANTKFDSGCGWPSFDDEIPGAIVRHEDLSLGRQRTEICCSNCDGHLGHVFHGEKVTKKDTRHCVNSLSIKFKAYSNLDKATFGAGCFWSVQQMFNNCKGVYLTQVGYMGGNTSNPTYEEVCDGTTNHAEVVEIYYDSSIISYNDLLLVFWQNHNPTSLNMQGNDIGTQYRSVIFYHSEQQKKLAEDSLSNYQLELEGVIVTQISQSEIFFRAEEYHQNYIDKNNLGSCRV